MDEVTKKLCLLSYWEVGHFEEQLSAGIQDCANVSKESNFTTIPSDSKTLEKLDGSLHPCFPQRLRPPMKNLLLILPILENQQKSLPTSCRTKWAQTVCW